MTRRRSPLLALALCGLFTVTLAVTLAHAQPPSPPPLVSVAAGEASPEEQEVALFIADHTRDGLERFNRGSFWFNHRLLYRLIEYPARGYRRITPHAFRRGVHNFATNLSGPRRILNNLFQGQWGEAGTESKRFLVNTTVGVLGLFDPATHWWDMRLYDEDFGQTVGYWGVPPGAFLEAPFLGPSDPRDLLAGILDWAMDPLSYLPGGRLVVQFNEISMNLAEYDSIFYSVNDPYMLIRDGFRLMREAQVRDVSPVLAPAESAPAQDLQFTPQDRAVAGSAAALQDFPAQDPHISSLAALQLEPDDINFFRRGRDRRVRLTATDQRFTFRLWKHDESSPILFLMPGLGGHFTGSGATALAEVFFDAGFDVVVIPSAFHGEFSRQASTVPLPGHVELDARDSYTAMIDILDYLHGRYTYAPDTPNVVAGISIGGTHALFMAELDRQAEHPRFTGFLALNPVVSLCHATRNLDQLFDAPSIPSAPGQEDPFYDSLVRVSQFVQASGDPPHGQPAPPLRSEDAAFGVGVFFRMQLADIIFESQRRDDRGILRTPLRRSRGAPSYAEIMQIGFAEYVQHFIGGLVDEPDFDALCARGSLQAIQSELSADPRVRVIHSANDFLLGPGDLAFLRDTFHGRLTLFNTGGHCGNYHLAQVQQAMRDAASTLVRQAGTP